MTIQKQKLSVVDLWSKFSETKATYDQILDALTDEDHGYHLIRLANLQLAQFEEHLRSRLADLVDFDTPDSQPDKLFQAA